MMEHKEEGRAFFRRLMQDLGVAYEFLKTYLDKEVARQVDWDLLTLHQEPLPSDGQESRYSDVVYRTLSRDARTELFFLLNYEESASEPFLLDTIVYLASVLGQGLRYKPPLMIQLTVYNGLEYPYPHGYRFIDQYAGPEVGQEPIGEGRVRLPEESYLFILSLLGRYADKALASQAFFDAHRIIDFRDESDESLLRHEYLSSLGIGLKHAHDKELCPWIRANPGVIAQFKTRPYAEAAWHYLLSTF